MRKLLILGNGFDLYCGLPTSFYDFKKYLETYVVEQVVNSGYNLKTLTYLKEGNDVSLENISKEKEITTWNELFELTKNGSYKNGELYFISKYWNTLDELSQKSNWGDVENFIEENIELIKEFDSNAIGFSFFIHAMNEWIINLPVQIEKSIETNRQLTNLINKLEITDIANFNFTNIELYRESLDAFKNIKNVFNVHGVAKNSNKEYGDEKLMDEILSNAKSENNIVFGPSIEDERFTKWDKNFQALTSGLVNDEINLENIDKVYVFGHSFNKSDDYFYETLLENNPKVEVNLLNYEYDKHINYIPCPFWADANMENVYRCFNKINVKYESLIGNKRLNNQIKVIDWEAMKFN